MRNLLLLLLILVCVSWATAGEEITDKKQLAALHRAISAADYVCPAVKMAKLKDMTAEGQRVKVWCGPDDGSTNVYSGLIYVVTIRPRGKTQVEKSGLFGS